MASFMGGRVASGVKYIVDCDDAVCHRYDMLENNLLRRVIGKKTDQIMRSTNLVAAWNDYLANRALNSGAKRVVIIPTIIDLNRYLII